MGRETSAQAARMLLAHLQLRAPGARTVLLASPRSWKGMEQLTAGVADLATGLYKSVSVVHLHRGSTNRLANAGTGESASSSTQASESAARAGAPPALVDSLTVLSGRGLLDDAETLLASHQADGTVLVCIRGKTTRDDLAEARAELERAGARLLGAVLVG